MASKVVFSIANRLSRRNVKAHIGFGSSLESIIAYSPRTVSNNNKRLDNATELLNLLASSIGKSVANSFRLQRKFLDVLS